MDTRMIEVAIGLALVFAMTSLLAAAVQEGWSSIFGMRGKILHQAIVSFFGDDEAFAQAVLKHPLLVSLSPQTQDEVDKRRPSYVGGDSIVAALLAHLVQTHTAGVRPTSPLELVQAVLGVATRQIPADSALAPSQPAALLAGAELRRPNAQFARGLSSLVMGVESDWPAFEARLVGWFDAVGARSTGWFKRRTQVGVFVIGLLTAAAVNINPIVIGPRLWQDEALRKTVVTAAERASADYAQASSSAASAAAAYLAASAAADALKWSAGSASDARDPTHLTATESARAAAVSAVTQARKALRSALNAAITDVKSDQGNKTALIATFNRSEDAGALLDRWAAGGGMPGSAELKQAVEGLRAPLPAELGGVGSLAQVRTQWAAQLSSAEAAQRSAPEATTLPATRKPEPRLASASCAAAAESSAELNMLCNRLDELGALRQAGVPLGWSQAVLPSVFSERWLNYLLIPVGWLVTALACTLGAPFWFDMLGKLVRLRGSGGRPEGTGTSGDTKVLGGTGGNLLPEVLARSGGVGAASGAGPGGTAMSDAMNDAEHALAVAEVQRIQRTLDMAEVDVTGFFDGNTRVAIKSWQTRQGFLPATGELSASQIAGLLDMQATARQGEGDGAVG
jgi:hypothetical protein